MATYDRKLHALDQAYDIAEIDRAERLAAAKAKGFRRFLEPNYQVNASARRYDSHYENPWDHELSGQPVPRWMDSLGKRVAIRGITRGVMSAGFLTTGNYILTHHYTPYSAMTERAISRQSGLSGGINRSLNVLAKGYDLTVGTPLKAAAKLITGSEETAANFVSFRNTRAFNREGQPILREGRSYGEEAVAITLDFALGSIGDSWGRNIVGILDPNVKKSWIHDGHIDFKDFAKSTAKSALHILSYNQMEDWFAAIPYVFQMRMQRHVLDKFQPGARIALDRSFNGGGLRIDKEGRAISDYALSGAADLQLRFMGYNVYTLMFRDLYNHVKDSFHHRHDAEKPAHERNVFSETAKYLVKTAIKANLYMAPAVPFFWLFRTSHGMLNTPRIYSEMGEDGQRKEGIAWIHDSVTGNSAPHTFRTRGANLPTNGLSFTIGHMPEDRSMPFTPATQLEYRPVGRFGQMLSPIGKFQGRLGRHLGNALTDYFHEKPAAAAADKRHPYWGQRSFVHEQSQNFVNNSLSYTPYMVAKYETANLWDTPQMDAAIYRMIDGVASFRTAEVKAGLKDIGNVMRRLPVSVKTEAMAREPRGLVNSTQLGHDSEDKRDGRLRQTFAERQRAAKLAKLHAKPGTDGVELPMAAGDTPHRVVSTRDTTGISAYQVSPLTPDRPAGATLH